MVEALPMRVSHLAAVATLVALLGAMFVAMGSVSAADCTANPDITLGVGDTCTITHKSPDGLATSTTASSDNTAAVADPTVSSSNATAGMITIDGTAVGSATVTVSILDTKGTGDTADDTTEMVKYDVTVAGFGIKSLAVKGDNDRVVSAGPKMTVVATLRSATASESKVRLTVPTTGLSIETDSALGTTSQSHTQTVGNSGGTAMLEFVVNTAGAPTGTYTLTFTADNDGMFGTTSSNPIAANDPENESPAERTTRLENSKQDTQTLEITIGDPGTGLTSATLSLGNSAEDKPYTADNEAVAETGTAPAATGDGINLVIEAFDSLGGKSNAAVVDQVIVIAPGGEVSAGTGNTATVASNQSGATFTENTANDNPADNVGSRMVINVKKAGGNSAKPGMVTVYAIVSGSGGAATTDPVTLNFSGKTSSISIGEATDTLRSVNVDGDDANDTVEPAEYDSITLAVTGADDGGIANDPGEGFNITITGPDSNRVNSNKIEAMLATAYAGGKRDLTLTGKGAPGAALMAGEYTVMLKKGSLEASAMFSVAGSASDVMVSANETTSDTIGDVITVTAEITDADGNPVSDGTSVQFDVSSNTGLAAIGTGHMGKDTKDGMASVKYAVVGAGHSVVSATAGGATGVIVIDSTAGMVEEEAMPEEEASVSCLSELSGFATWSCGVEADASAIFDMVTGRGVSAIHLWNGSTWVRYSVVDDAMVPGSSDFMVTENDILYISN